MRQIRVRQMSPILLKLCSVLLIIAAVLATIYVFECRVWWVLLMAVIFIADSILLNKCSEIEIWEEPEK